MKHLVSTNRVSLLPYGRRAAWKGLVGGYNSTSVSLDVLGVELAQTSESTL